jgi:hypothetical protein
LTEQPINNRIALPSSQRPPDTIWQVEVPGEKH